MKLKKFIKLKMNYKNLIRKIWEKYNEEILNISVKKNIIYNEYNINSPKKIISRTIKKKLREQFVNTYLMLNKERYNFELEKYLLIQ